MARSAPAKRNPNPKRGYSWAPFAMGHTVNQKHGARNDRLVEPRARELVGAIFESNNHLDEVRDGPAVFRYGVALARCERVYMWLCERDDVVFSDVEAGAVHAVYERLEKWERQCDNAEERLAIAPLTRARLGLDRMRAEAMKADALQAFLAEQGDGDG